MRRVHSMKRFRHEGIEEVFSCPVCKTRVAPPICQCRRGHIVCRRCFRRLTRCPICRDRLSSFNNHTVDKLARNLCFPCCFSEHGCTAMPMAYVARASHEQFCVYRPLRCPKETCLWEEKFSENNERVTSVAELENHLRASHSSDFVFCHDSAISVQIPLPNMVSHDCGEPNAVFSHFVLSYGKSLFLAVIQVRPHARRRVGVYASVTEMDRPRRGGSEFQYTVRSKGGECELIHMAPILSYLQAWPGPGDQPDHRGMALSLRIVNPIKYTEQDGLLHLECCVTPIIYDVDY